MIERIHKALVLLRTPAGRHQLGVALAKRLWPAARLLGAAYRGSLARGPHVVAVVGSLGKTTTSRALSAALGFPLDRLSAGNDTIYVALSMLRVRPWEPRAVIEVGISAPGQMRRYMGLLRPDVAVVTSIASEHRLAMPTLEITRHEKAHMVRALTPAGLAVLNGDDPNVLWMRGQTRARVVTFGFGEGNDVRASAAVLDWPHGTRFTLHAGGEVREVRTRLLGRAFVYAILAAVAVGLSEGFPLDELLERLAALPPSEERLQPVRLASGAILLRDDFKGTLESVDAALDVLEAVSARRKIVVLGDATNPPGNRRELYRRLGGRVAKAASHAVFFGTLSEVYVAGATRAGMSREAVVDAGSSLEKALAGLPTDLGEGDVVLIKGRSSQRLGRIALALEGRVVRCAIPFCPLDDTVSCGRCAMLERDWSVAELSPEDPGT